ncbi:hypothetical protein V7128_01620 [Neobacillus vireti]|uniref:hypothetical protein n=1 Tax=Neobacillus vireti TaxID=220686 RepID=UPI002FFF35F3
MKFQVGDSVKIVSISDTNEITKDDIPKLIGSTGKIIKIDKNYIYPYEIEFDADELNMLGYDFWSGDELESINKKRETWEGLCIDDDKIYILEWIHEQIKHKPWGTWKVDVSITEQEITEDGEIVDIE